MLSSYIYILIQMLLILICINIIDTARKHAPPKVKILTVAVLALEIVRLISNGILFLSDNIIFLYILKYFNFMNIAVIPVAALIGLYIFYRSDNLKFDYVIMAGLAILAGCLMVVFNMDYYIKRTQLYGYRIYLEHCVYIQLFELGILSVVLILGILALGRKVANNTGLMLLIFAAAVTMLEIVLVTLNVEFLSNQILGDITWIIVLQYTMNTMRTNKSR